MRACQIKFRTEFSREFSQKKYIERQWRIGDAAKIIARDLMEFDSEKRRTTKSNKIEHKNAFKSKLNYVQRIIGVLIRSQKPETPHTSSWYLTSKKD